MDIYEKSRGILFINIVIICYVLFIFGPSISSNTEFIVNIFLLLVTLYLINDNIFAYNEKCKKITYVVTIIIIVCSFLVNNKEFELYSFVMTFFRFMLFFFAIIEGVFVIEGIVVKKKANKNK